jgi:hypothetical protein
LAKFEVKQSEKDSQWYWHFRANNGKIVADSAEGYVNKDDCVRGIQIVKSEAPGADIVYL